LLFDELPLNRAMPDLVPGGPQSQNVLVLADRASADKTPLIQAATWLYVDDLARSHEIVQAIDMPLGAYWHGILHRREGDYSNAKYWLRKIGDSSISINGYSPCGFVDQCEAASGRNIPELVAIQRLEWEAVYMMSLEASK
jgi:hypothetical protein